MAELISTYVWFAYVKYKDNEKEIVLMSKISDVNDEEQKIQLQSKDLNDYVYGKLYSVRTSLHSKDGKESKYYAVIGKLIGKKFFKYVRSSTCCNLQLFMIHITLISSQILNLMINNNTSNFSLLSNISHFMEVVVTRMENV